MRVFHISMRSVGETSGLDFPVARVPVPRDCWIARARTMARDRPSPYGEGGVFFIVARGPVPALSIVTMCVPASVVCARLITNGSRSGTGRALLHGVMKHPQFYISAL